MRRSGREGRMGLDISRTRRDGIETPTSLFECGKPKEQRLKTALARENCAATPTASACNRRTPQSDESSRCRARVPTERARPPLALPSFARLPLTCGVSRRSSARSGCRTEHGNSGRGARRFLRRELLDSSALVNLERPNPSRPLCERRVRMRVRQNGSSFFQRLPLSTAQRSRRLRLDRAFWRRHDSTG
jgi:hypothetical protein